MTAKGGCAMGKIAKGLRELAKSNIGSAKDALAYIETGDPKALGRIRSYQSSDYWTVEVRGLMADPGAMGEEDRRALHALAAKEVFDQIGQWLSQALGRAKGDEDFFGIVGQELAAVKVPPATV